MQCLFCQCTTSAVGVFNLSGAGVQPSRSHCSIQNGQGVQRRRNIHFFLGGKDRHDCIYACAGIRKCLLAVCFAELRRVQKERIKAGTKISFAAFAVFCALISAVIFVFAKDLMCLFVDADKIMIIAEGARYLRIEGAMYVGIGILFLWYGYFRGINKPNISLLLTVISLGTRVLLSYTLAPNTGFGVVAIWASIPVGWFLADIAGCIFYRSNNSVKWK